MQSFGHEHEYKRAVFAILSYYAHLKQHHDERNTILFTDKPAYFAAYLKDLPVQYVTLTLEKIREMRGEIDFLHRIKIAILEEAFELAGDNLIYTDSDTFFTADPVPLFKELSESVSFMHKEEYSFDFLKNMPLPAGIPFRAFFKLITEKCFSRPDGSNLYIEPILSSWNAGAMILHRSHLDVLPLVYHLTDQFYPATLNHASEQYAFSIALQGRTKVYPCDAIVYHYWHRVKKEIVDAFLMSRINEQFAFMPLESKISLVKRWSEKLPEKFTTHVLTLRDNAVQAFNENKFKLGYYYASWAMLRNPANFTFLKDILYHTKRFVFG